MRLDLLFVLIQSLRSLIIDHRYVCQCSELVNQVNCSQNPTCFWNSSGQCVKWSCSQYTAETCPVLGTCGVSQGKCVDGGCQYQTTQQGCFKDAYRCYWTYTVAANIQQSCQPFTDCYKLPNPSQINCVQQNPLCGFNAIAGTCEPASVNQCSSQTAATCTQTNEGYCTMYANGKCGVMTCTLMDSERCINSFPYCVWTAVGQGGNCSAASCASFTKELDCKVAGSGGVGSSYTLCAWNSGVCQNAVSPVGIADPIGCYWNTYGTYRWNSANTASGVCTQCIAKIISAILICLLIIL